MDRNLVEGDHLLDLANGRIHGPDVVGVVEHERFVFLEAASNDILGVLCERKKEWPK